MKIVKMACILLCLIMCVSFTGCVNNLSDTITPPPGYFDPTPSPKPTPGPLDITPVLYKIANNSGSYVWLFPVVDITNDSALFLPQYVSDAFETSDFFAIEYGKGAFDSAIGNKGLENSYIKYPDGITVKDCVSPSYYDKAVEIIGENLSYSEEYDNCISSYWAEMIKYLTEIKTQDNNRYDVESFIGIVATNSDKSIRKLEDEDYYYKIISNYSEALQEALLKEAVDMYYNTDAVIENNMELLKAWLAGDTVKLKEFSESEINKNWDKNILDEYIEKNFNKRNADITAWMESALESGREVFFCIDYSNVLAEGGIIDMLNEKGYTVEVIKQ